MLEREMERRNRERPSARSLFEALHSPPPRNPAQPRPRPRNPPTTVPVTLPNPAQPSPPPQNPPTPICVRYLRRPVGIDLICNRCQHHVPGSRELWITYRYYPRYDPWGPRWKCFTHCLNCCDEWELRRLNGNNFAVYAGATQHFPAEEDVPSTSDDGPLVLWRELRR
ncbi:hypothetical protein CASFOL_035282 [Castilleja foliolosa]|uniref:Uncharacterized protein n=1 Tax=Castilleja foliolosa TaxID=1961234 RepID=A0ABD3BS57_9LAMI